MSKAVLGVLVLSRLMAADPVCAQPTTRSADSEYLRLVDAYAHGEIAHETDALAGWSDTLLEGTVRRALDSPGINRKAAVMLHTESAFAMLGSERSALHLRFAQLFLDRISGNGASAFKSRWEACVEILKNVLLNLQDRGETARLLGKSELEMRLLRSYDDPKSGAVQFAAGLYQELNARLYESNLRGQWHLPNRVAADRNARNSDDLEDRLNDAIAAYRRALAKEPDLLEARLRLGWVLLVHHSWEAAREQLDQVVARATEPNMQYLAHLFRGALEEGKQHPHEALHEYEMAYAIVPGEAAAVGLMQVEMLQGLSEQAPQVATDLAGKIAVAGHPDPWHSYLHGVTNDAQIEELRAEARTP